MDMRNFLPANTFIRNSGLYVNSMLVNDPASPSAAKDAPCVFSVL
jgi:hypothetical protein